MNRYFVTYKNRINNYEYFKPMKSVLDLWNFVNDKIELISIYKIPIWNIIKYKFYIIKIFLFERFIKKDFLKPKIYENEDFHAYEMTDYFTLKKIFKDLSIKNNDCILDAGCGKGLAIICMSKFFKNIIGIEYDEEIFNIAKNNLLDVNFKVELINEDIKNFNIEDRNINYVFMNNPFGGDIMDSFISKLKNNTTIIYHNPVCKSILKKYDFEEVSKYKDVLGVDISIYSNCKFDLDK